MIATPRPGRVAGRRVRSAASALASSSSSCGSVAQRAEDAPVAGDGARVRLRRRRAGAGEPRLEHGHADALARAPLEGGAPARAVTLVLDVDGDGADAVVPGDRGHVLGGRDDRLVAGGDDGVQAQAPARRERVDGEVAALGDEGDRPRLARGDHVAPERHAGGQVDDAVAVRAADRQVVRAGRGHEPLLERAAAAGLGEARREDDGPARAARAGLRDGRGRVRGGDRDDDGVGRRVEVGERRHAGEAVHPLATGVDAVHGAREAQAPQVQQRLASVGARPLGGADDGDRARAQQPVEVHR
jgi:hypothetical protein